MMSIGEKSGRHETNSRFHYGEHRLEDPCQETGGRVAGRGGKEEMVICSGLKGVMTSRTCLTCVNRVDKEFAVNILTEGIDPGNNQ